MSLATPRFYRIVTVALLAALALALLHAGLASAAVPDVGSGKEPPGFDKLKIMLSWAAYLGIVACVAGLIICGGTMALEHRNGGGGGIGGRVGAIMGGCVLIGTASAIVAALV
jgi:hypothetical protein